MSVLSEKQLDKSPLFHNSHQEECVCPSYYVREQKAFSPACIFTCCICFMPSSFSIWIGSKFLVCVLILCSALQEKNFLFLK